MTITNNEFIAGYFRLADSMADLIGPHCEVVIHSLADFDHSVIKIVNGHHTGRNVGSPMTDLGLRMVKQIQKTGELTPKSYFTKNKDGALLKSTTCVITGENEQPIGLFCVNMNLSYPFPEIIKTMMPNNEISAVAINENFSANPTEIIEQTLNNIITDVDNDPHITMKKRNKEITRLLFESGIFELKEAIVLIAQRLKITRHAVYKYIREFKENHHK